MLVIILSLNVLNKFKQIFKKFIQQPLVLIHTTHHLNTVDRCDIHTVIICDFTFSVVSMQDIHKFQTFSGESKIKT